MLIVVQAQCSVAPAVVFQVGHTAVSEPYRTVPRCKAMLWMLAYSRSRDHITFYGNEDITP